MRVFLDLLNEFTNTIPASFTTECGHPGILKSMSTSFDIERSWFASRQTTGLSVLSWIVSSPTLRIVLSQEERVWEPSGTLFVWQLTTGCSVLSCRFIFNVIKLLLSSDERVWVAPVSTTGRPVLILSSEPNWCRPNIQWFWCLVHALCMYCAKTRCIQGFGWVDWELCACRATSPSGCRATSEPDSFTKLCFKEIFGGGRGDAYTYLVYDLSFSIRTTFGIL